MINNGFMDNMMSQPLQRTKRTTKKDIIDFIMFNTKCSDLVGVEYCENVLARHICAGGNTIQILQKQSYPLQTESGIVNIEYFFCNICRKCIVDKNTIEPIG